MTRLRIFAIFVIVAVVSAVGSGCAPKPAEQRTPPPTTTSTVAPTTTTSTTVAPSTTAPRPPSTRASRSSARRLPPVPAAGSNTGYDWRSLVLSLPWDGPLMLRVIWCESRNDPNARNPHSSATGLLQILGGSTDPETNIRHGFAMWQRSGMRPWAASRGCWS